VAKSNKEPSASSGTQLAEPESSEADVKVGEDLKESKPAAPAEEETTIRILRSRHAKYRVILPFSSGDLTRVNKHDVKEEARFENNMMRFDLSLPGDKKVYDFLVGDRAMGTEYWTINAESGDETMAEKARLMQHYRAMSQLELSQIIPAHELANMGLDPQRASKDELLVAVLETHRSR